MAVTGIGPETRIGIGPVKSLDGAASTGAGTRYRLEAPMSDWGIQVVSNSCNVSVTLEAALGTTADSTTRTTLITWAASSAGGAQASGEIVWSTAKYPATEIVAVLDANASSGGTDAWIVGTP